MHKSTRIFAIIVLMLGFLAISNGLTAQNVKLEGNTFVQQSSNADSVSTGYYYQDSQGFKYPVFLSSKGKAYCWLKSKKTGKTYKRYLPKITEILKKENYGRRTR